MSPRTIAIILVAVGLVLGVVSLLADTLGLGGSPGTFGSRQIIALVVGVVIVVVGVVLYLRAGQNTNT